MRYCFLICIFICAFFLHGSGQTTGPKREMRAVWIATVGNIDWPSKKGLTAQQQQQEFINHLEFLKRTGFNTVIVQIRPAADALYESSIEPWSNYLSGKQGQAPFPKYDPLEFMIAETHKRNMEFHAWLNPYRALVNAMNNPNPANHPTRKNPNWIINFDNKGYFDPGNPEVREYILGVFLDVVKRYDLDAIHIDDYFYPYPVAGKVFNDNTSYMRYNEGMNKEDWRRNNVNLFISQLNFQIKREKPWVQFGVSPFGVWRNRDKDSNGSNTIGATSCYDDLYSDILLWIDKKWVDYVAPQLYWEHGHRVAPYEILLPWWQKNKGSTDLYIGLGVYRMVGATPKSKYFNASEILKQIQSARQQRANGVVMYSLTSFNKISNELADSLKFKYFANIALPPAFKVDGLPLPKAPIVQSELQNTKLMLSWKLADDHKTIGKEKYLVYKFNSSAAIDLNNAAAIMVLTSNKYYLDPLPEKGSVYVITTVDRCWNESSMSNVIVY